VPLDRAAPRLKITGSEPEYFFRSAAELRPERYLTCPSDATMIGAMLRPGGIFLVAVAILLAGLTPLAYADLPDPAWISGYWDDDDFDTVVEFITTMSAISAPAVIDAGALWLADDCVGPAEHNVLSASLETRYRPRAPPVSLPPGT